MAVQPEMIGDVDEGTPTGPVNDNGLTADEQAAFDAMKPEPGESDAPPEPEPEPDAPSEVEPKPDVVPPVLEADDEEEDPAPVDPKTGKTSPPKTVNFGKHQRLLAKAQKEAETLRTENERTKIEQARLAERLAILNEALTAPPAPDPAAAQAAAVAANPMLEETINPADDAIKALDQMQRRQVWLAENQNSFTEAAEANNADRELFNSFQRDTAAYSATPEGKDFFGDNGAYQYLKNSRLVELGISLFDKDPTDPAVKFTAAEVNRMVADFNAEEKWVVNNALSSQKSPSQAIMKLARGRGWRPPEAPVPPVGWTSPAARAQARGPQPPRGGIPEIVAPAAQTAVARIQAEKAGAAASRSLSDGGGAPPGEPLTMERLNAMNDAEFAKYIDNMPAGALESIMGKPGAGY